MEQTYTVTRRVEIVPSGDELVEIVRLDFMPADPSESESEPFTWTYLSRCYSCGEAARRLTEWFAKRRFRRRLTRLQASHITVLCPGGAVRS